MSFLTERLFQILDQHRVYNLVQNAATLRFFMERHVICVWAYHALLRSLQKELIAHSLPLNSDDYKEALRLLAEIILDEEVEDLGDGKFVSHLELYLDAMQEARCDIAPILGFFDMLEHRVPLERALEEARFPAETMAYARYISSLLDSPIHMRAAALFYEGEPFIPDRFLHHLFRLGDSIPVDRLLDYFERHIEGLKKPGFSAAGRLVELFCRADPTLNREAEIVAEKLMGQRIDLWNNIAWGVDQFFMEPACPEHIVPARHLRLVISR